MGIAIVVGMSLVAIGFVIWFNENVWKLREAGYQLKLSAKQEELDRLQEDFDKLNLDSKSWVDASLNHRVKNEETEERLADLVEHVKCEIDGVIEHLDNVKACAISIRSFVSPPPPPPEPKSLLEVVNEERRRMLEEELCSLKNS